MTDAIKPPDYIFPTMRRWADHVKTRADVDQLNDAVKVLNLAKSRTGIHPFILQDKMGLAIWHLNQRAEELGLYKVHDGTYRQSSTLDVK